VVINTEWGAFGDNGCIDFLRTSLDKEVDSASINPGKHLYANTFLSSYHFSHVLSIYNPLGNLNSGRSHGERSSFEATFRWEDTWINELEYGGRLWMYSMSFRWLTLGHKRALQVLKSPTRLCLLDGRGGCHLPCRRSGAGRSAQSRQWPENDIVTNLELAKRVDIIIPS